MRAFVELVIRQLVGEDSTIFLTEEATEHNRSFVLVLPASELGKVIGKQGHTIQAIRSLLVGAASSGHSIRFEAHEQGNA